MSLSSQYLEELSKRYKRQVEELQQSFTKTILAIEEHNLRNQEREQRNNEENRKLRESLAELSDRINNFENLVLFVGIFVMVQVIFLFLLIKYCGNGRNATNQEDAEVDFESTENAYVAKKKSTKHKRRRRSLNDICEQLLSEHISPSTQVSFEEFQVPTPDGDIKAENNKKKVKNRRKNSAPVLMQQNKKRQTVIPLMPLHENHSNSNHRQKLTRTESAPSKVLNSAEENFANSSTTIIDEQPLLEDNDEFIIPGSSDLSVYGMTDNDKQDISSTVSTDSIKTNSSHKFLSKTRRLSSPTFLKQALTRKSSKKEKGEKSNWEWYKISKSNGSDRRKAKSESPPPTDKTQELLKVNGNGSGNDADEKLSNGEVKNSNSSFKRFLKKVF